MTLSLPFDTVDSVVRSACLTVDRCDDEQRALLAMAFAADCHRKETADELGVGVNWLVTRLVEEGLERMDLSNWTLVRRV